MRTILFILFLLLIRMGLYSQTYFLFVGTYTDKGSKGIYVYEFNTATGRAILRSNTDGIVNPSFLAVSPDQKMVYAVTETARENAGSVSAFAFDRTSATLRFVNKQLSGGDNPCYVSVHKNNKWIAIGNYSGGSLSVFPINADGSLKPFSQTIQHTGSGINKSRQEKAHVHSTVFSPDYKYLFVPDLGMDKVMIYSFNNLLDQPLRPAPTPFVETTPGNGPRHFTFHPNGKYAYLAEEMSGTVAAYKYANGQLLFLQRLACHPKDFTGALGGADIHLSPDGRFLYVSNRGDQNTISIFSVNQQSGKLKIVGSEPTQGKVPRNFIVDPTGNFLLVANQSTDNIVVFKRNEQTGLLSPTGEQIKVPTPVCLQMIPKN